MPRKHRPSDVKTPKQTGSVGVIALSEDATSDDEGDDDAGDDDGEVDGGAAAAHPVASTAA